MTIPLSTWDQAVPAIVAAINLQPAVVNPPPGYPTGGNILVQEGPPGTFQPDDIIIVDNNGIGQTANWHALVGGGGQGSLDEKYRIGVMIEVFRGGSDDTPADDPALIVRTRCKALADAVDVAVRTDPSLGGVVLSAYPAAHTFSACEWADGSVSGRVMSCQIEIECVAVI